MIVSEIKNIEKEDTHIYYRQKYIGTAIYTILGKEQNGKVEFFVEHKPTGETEIQVQMIDKIDYPLLQIMMELKACVRRLIEMRKLP